MHLLPRAYAAGVFKTAGEAKKNVKNVFFFIFFVLLSMFFAMCFLYSDFSNVSVI
jgi:hypothetical protein